MKPLSKLHAEAIAKAMTANDQNKAAAMAMIETPMELIKAIILKHELAVIEVMRELHESLEVAVRAEREACAKVVEDMDVQHPKHIAAAIRARGTQGKPQDDWKPVPDLA